MRFRCCKFCSYRWFGFVLGFRAVPFAFRRTFCQRISLQSWISVWNEFDCRRRFWDFTGVDVFCAFDTSFSFPYQWGSFLVPVQTDEFPAFFVAWWVRTCAGVVAGWKGNCWTRDCVWRRLCLGEGRFRGWCNFIAFIGLIYNWPVITKRRGCLQFKASIMKKKWEILKIQIKNAANLYNLKQLPD